MPEFSTASTNEKGFKGHPCGTDTSRYFEIICHEPAVHHSTFDIVVENRGPFSNLRPEVKDF